MAKPKQKKTEQEAQTQMDLLLASIDVLDGDKDLLKKFGPPVVYALGVAYAVAMMSGLEMPNAVHAVAVLVAGAGGWFSRNAVQK